MDNKGWVCKKCFLAVQQDRIPTCLLANDIQFPLIPEELKLTHVEERLISPSLAFMQLADVNTTFKLLLRMLDNTKTIPI